MLASSKSISASASRPAVVGASVALAPSPAKSVRRRHLTELKSLITSPLHKLGRLFGVSHSTTSDEEEAPAAPHVPQLRGSNSSVGSAASAQHRQKTNGVKRRLQHNTDDDEEEEAEEEEEDDEQSGSDEEESSASSASSSDEEVRETKTHEPVRRRPAVRAREASSSSSSATSSPVAAAINRYAGRLATTSTPALSKLAPVHAAAPSAAAASSDTPLSPIPRFNGNQWKDRFGNPRLPASAAANKQAKKKPRTEEKGPASSAATPIRTTGPAASSFSAAAAAPSRAPATLKSLATPPARPVSKVSQLPFSSLSSLPGGSPHVNTVQYRPLPYTMPGSAAASAMFSAVQAAAAASSAQASSAAAAAASSSSSSSSVSRLFPHPNAMGSHAFHGRSGSSAGTPRKNQQHLNQLQHAAAAHHNHAYHSAAAGTPLVFAHHFPHAQPYVYKHFRGRPPKSATAKNKAKLSLQSHLSASSSSLAGLSSPSTHASAAAADQRRKGGSTVPAGIPPKVAGKKRDRPYKDLVAENLARHRCNVPDEGADWLWQALQHRTPFANVTLTDGTAAPATVAAGATTSASNAAAPAAAASSSSAAPSAAPSSSLSALSPFSRPLPLTESTIKQYTAFQEADEKHLSLYVGLRPLVRYHRLRGLVPPPGPPVKKPNGRPRIDRSEKEPPRSPDDILDTLMHLTAREGARLTEIEEEDEQMEAADTASSSSVALSSYRAQRPQRSIAEPSPAASSSSAASASSSHHSSFYSALSNTSLLPTSLSMPLLPEYRKSFSQVPLSLQLFLARFSVHLPPGDSKATLKPKRHHVVLHAPAGGTGKGAHLAAAVNDEEWMDKMERLLPRPHRKLVRLFYAHVKLPPRREGVVAVPASATAAAGAAASSSSAPPTTLLTAHPLHDLVYHFNSTSLCAHLLHHCYTSDPRFRKFVFPVESTDLPAYYRNVIKCPLSLADLDLRVVCGYYDSPLELLSDLWRTFENTLLWRDGGKTNSKSDVREEVTELWASIEAFLDSYYCSFMTHTPNGCLPSPRTLPAVTAAHLAQIKVWMREVAGREIPRLQLVWIKKRERVAPPTDDQAEMRSARYARTHTASSSSSSSSSAAAASSASSYGAFLEANRLSDWSEYVAPPDSSSSPTPDDHGAEDSDSSTASSSRPRKKSKLAAAASARPTRAHPYSQLDPSSPLARLADPHARFPPDFFSRSRGARHADNLPPALLRKLARRAGKIPYSWDARWFLTAKLN